MEQDVVIVPGDEALSLEKNNEDFFTLPQLWRKDRYPDDYLLCEIGFSLAKQCCELHQKDMLVANEWNESNILVDIKGHVSIKKVYTTDTLSGSYYGIDGYLSPEYYQNHRYDLYSDYYGMAVFFYRLFVGGFPMDGKKTYQYLLNNNLSVQEAASTIYGSMAVFAFDPRDKRNTIRDFVMPFNPRMLELQTQRWDAIDDRIKKCFIQTFSDGIQEKGKTERTSDCEWMQIFKTVEKSGLKICPICKRRLFIGRTVCPWCK